MRLASPGAALLFSAIKSRPIKASYPGGWLVLDAGTIANAHRLAAEWQADSLVTYAGVNGRSAIELDSFVPNDPYFVYNFSPGQPGQWHLINTGNVGGAGIDARVQTPWLSDWTGSGVVIGIVDDSLQHTHPDLSPNYSAADSWDFGGGDGDPSPVTSDDTHGTSVAGVAAARGGNGIGVTGAAPFAKVAGLRFSPPLATNATLAAAIEYRSTGADTTIKIKNHSYSSRETYVAVADQLTALANSSAFGTIHCHSAGNKRGEISADSVKKGIQNSPHSITVAALAPRGDFADYSNYGACVFVTAPSNGYIFQPPSVITEWITTTDVVGSGGYGGIPDDAYTRNFGGTSSSTPLVSGVLALLKQMVPTLNTRFAKHLLARYSEKVDLSDSTPTSDGGWKTNGAGLSFNQNYGFGMINAQSLISNAPGWKGVSAPTQATKSTTNVAQPVPDSPGIGSLGAAVSRSFSITSTTPLEEVQVTLSLAHSRRGDLEARLTSPSGTTSRLMHRDLFDTSNEPINWTFTSNAFWGENPTGTWVLAVQDAYPGATGTWNSYSVLFRQGTLQRPDFTVTLSPSSIVGGGTSTGTVTLPAPAASNTPVSLAYTGSGITGPSGVTINAGSASASFTVNSVTVDSNVAGVVKAWVGSNFVEANLVVRRAGVSDVSLSQSPVPNATNVTGTVTLNGPLTSNRTVSLTYVPAQHFTSAPTTVLVPAGQNSATFTFRTNPVPEGFGGTITASLNGISDLAAFLVDPISLLGCQVYPINAYAGQRVFGVVRLAAPRAADLTVTVTSSHPALILSQVVTVPAGKTFGTFSVVAGNPTAGQQWVTLTSSAGAEVRTESTLVRPASNLLASGMNNSYQVGDGLTRHREFMSVVRGGESVLQAVYSKDTLVVLKSTGRVWTVGAGEYGQHGDGTSGPSAVKTALTQVPGLSNIVQIASVSELAVLALSSTGLVYGWGQNPHGQAGKSPFGMVTTPHLIPGLTNIVSIGSAATASFALDANGDIWSWGHNSSGDGARGSAGNTAVPTKLLTVAGPFVELGLGRNFGFAIHANGSLYGWGRNNAGQLGLGDFVNRTTLTPVPVSHVRQVGGGLSYGIALRTPPHGTPPVGGNREVLTTGGNTEGQRGQGTVGGPNTNTFALITNNNGNTNQIGAGNRHAFYVSQGVVRSWGVGSLGERADGTFAAALGAPTVIPSTPTVSGVLVSTNNSTLITQVPSTGRSSVLLTDGTNLRSADLRKNQVTNLTGTVPAGHVVVGGGEVSGNTARSEVITMNSAWQLFYMEANGTVLGPSTSLGVSLDANHLAAVSNWDNAGRMDFITINSVTRGMRVLLYNGSTQTGSYHLGFLADNEVIAGVGDFNVDRFQDLLVFNTETRELHVRLYRINTFVGVQPITNAPKTPEIPTAIPPVSPGLVPLAAAETMTGYSCDIVFVNGAALETWQLSRLNRVATGIVGPAMPSGFSSKGAWR